MVVDVYTVSTIVLKIKDWLLLSFIQIRLEKVPWFYFFSVVNMITRKITWYVPSSYVYTLQLVYARMCYCMSQGWAWEYYAYEINVLMVVHMHVYSKHPLRVSTLLCLGQYGNLKVPCSWSVWSPGWCYCMFQEGMAGVAASSLNSCSKREEIWTVTL